MFQPKTRRVCGGYTLLEMLVALVMFTVITFATAFALTTAMRAHAAAKLRADEAQEMRALFRVLGHDIREAYAVTGNPNTLFVAPGSDSGNVFTLTTLSNRIVSSVTNDTNSSQNNLVTDPSTAAAPQSDVVAVNYSFDKENGVLYRVASSIPNPDVLMQTPTIDTALSTHIRSISFVFTDSDYNTRSDWNYANLETTTSGTSSSSSTSSTSSSSSSALTLSSIISSTSTLDTTLPLSVQITVELDAAQGEGTHQYTTTIALANPQPQAAGQKPASTSTSTGGSSTGGSTTGGNRSIRRNGYKAILPILPGTLRP